MCKTCGGIKKAEEDGLLETEFELLPKEKESLSYFSDPQGSVQSFAIPLFFSTSTVPYDYRQIEQVLPYQPIVWSTGTPLEMVAFS
jgi:hypothetical protein